MNKSNLFRASALILLAAAGLVEACSDSKQGSVSDPDESAGSSNAGKPSSMSAAGESGMAGEPEPEPEPEGGSGGVEAEGGQAGALASGTAGTAGIAVGSGSSGYAGAAVSSGSSGYAGAAGKAGGGGTFGAGGSGGSAGKAGAGGPSGGGGTGGKAGGGGTSGSAGTAGGTQLFTPASASCAAGNIDTLFAVCRNCHSAPTKNGAPISLVTYEQIKVEADGIAYQLSNDLMPPPPPTYTISSGDKSKILAWLGAGAIGVPYSNGICP